MLSTREQLEKDGWKNGLLGEAYLLVEKAQGEFHPEQAEYDIIRGLLSKIEDADIALEKAE